MQLDTDRRRESKCPNCREPIDKDALVRVTFKGLDIPADIGVGEIGGQDDPFANDPYNPYGKNEVLPPSGENNTLEMH